MIKNVLMFGNGSVACYDEKGQQVPEWRRSLLCDHLKAMADAKVITRDTIVKTPTLECGVERLIGPIPD